MSNPLWSASRSSGPLGAARHTIRPLTLMAVLALLAALTAACTAPPIGVPAAVSASAATAAIASADQTLLEEQYGVQVTQVAVTAAGGMIDLRYKVLDPEKAKSFRDAEQNIVPAIVPAGTNITISAPGMMDETELETGKSYYILYANAYGAVQPGGVVIIQIGDVRVSHPVEP